MRTINAGPWPRSDGLAAGSATIIKGRPWAPAWLRNWLGDEFFQEVTSVQFLNRPLTDHDLAPLESLDRLEELAISGAPITDSGLKHIANLKELRILSLWETPGFPTPAWCTWPR